MAEVVSDFVSNSSRFHSSHTMVAGSGQQRTPAESPYRQRPRSAVEPPLSPRNQPTASAPGTPPSTSSARTLPIVASDAVSRSGSAKTEPHTPPASSSPVTPATKQRILSQKEFPESPAPVLESSTESRPKKEETSPLQASPIQRSARSLDDVKRYGGNTIKVRDLAHIQRFATEEFLSYKGQSGRLRTADDPALKYDISGMPISDIIEMVAGLLTKITTTNDRQHESLHRPLPSGEAANFSGQSSSVLAFHGKNVPSITILSYLSRIHKYCPTTYEVFLSLLVYFDRMTERVNAGTIQALNKNTVDQGSSPPSSGCSAEGSDLADSPPAKTSRSVPELSAELERAQYPHAPPREQSPGTFPLSHFFVVDSFNIHRLVIAGVTCASKFFSDVFYTNSRYAKVGGLPLPELNHLELQFLLLNDFRLSVPVEELEAYGTMLVEFYAREIIAQRSGQFPLDMGYPDDSKAALASASP
ncbi:cyclin-dependent protein kinase complex component (Pcl7) [Drepanopeziza brunnea f. sp. 'multigermtubi' MB_m1]|uniref:Cyclin-dependent protein kinase complex component (Pcl7) n=1 Tax=Marssonina brunnea f. sp. multigermtubi (strain MB_m1) TaxID=1072389 RepID=K1WI62_MARBU|nr:cyclin-dependent protein kinase complex component (Pcl7) [Drepanopeziza brunnea f. sp. 'multigermtubi' MB_m1]EKD17290.1 cyclin-dependent protein kinase complex component (Pcl7) [Drepanopeziza brunnea f. sp. 'multigermtubi' MB_m1]